MNKHLTSMNCPVCDQSYDTQHRLPKILPCGHTFCMSCLGELSENGNKQCPLDRRPYINDTHVTNFALLVPMSASAPAGKVIPISLISPPDTYYNTWSTALNQNYRIPRSSHKQLWEHLTEFLLIRKDHSAIRPTPKIDAAWHTLLLMPCFAHFVHEQYGGIIDHTPIAADQLTADEIALQDSLYVSTFLRACPWERETRGDGDEIFVKTLTGITIRAPYTRRMTVTDLKKIVNEYDGTEICQQRFIFAGKQLENEGRLSAYRISNGSTVHLVLKLSGC